MTDEIENAIEAEAWEDATQLIHQELASDPDNHWFIARLALCTYERRQYQEALTLATKASVIHPGCPLALWEYAGALDMLGREREAIRVWMELLQTEEDVRLDEPCWEDETWSESLLNNCRYRLIRAYLDLEDQESAWHWMQEHLAHRKAGLYSTVSETEVLVLGRRENLLPN